MIASGKENNEHNAQKEHFIDRKKVPSGEHLYGQKELPPKFYRHPFATYIQVEQSVHTLMPGEITKLIVNLKSIKIEKQSNMLDTCNARTLMMKSSAWRYFLNKLILLATSMFLEFESDTCSNELP